MNTISLTYFPEVRSFYDVKGRDALRFLQGMCTADLKRALGGTCYGYFLNLKGKPLAPTVFYAMSETHILLSLPEISGASTKAALEKYVVADDVEIIENPNLKCFQIIESHGLSPSVSELEIAHPVPGALDRVFSVVSINGGYRIARGLLNSSHEELWLNSEKDLPPNSKLLNDAEYESVRIAAGIPKWRKDFFEDSFLLEFPTQESISYHKGCYLGQEVVARTVYRGHVTRAFCRFESESPLKEDFIYMQSDTERPIGKITSTSGNTALGLARVVAFDSDVKTPLFQKNEKQEQQALKISKVLIPYEK